MNANIQGVGQWESRAVGDWKSGRLEACVCVCVELTTLRLCSGFFQVLCISTGKFCFYLNFCSITSSKNLVSRTFCTFNAYYISIRQSDIIKSGLLEEVYLFFPIFIPIAKILILRHV